MMVKQESTSSVSTTATEKLRDGRTTSFSTDAPTDEETAAIIAVLSLMQVEAPTEPSASQTSAWARAGKREAVRPWTGKE